MLCWCLWTAGNSTMKVPLNIHEQKKEESIFLKQRVPNYLELGNMV